MFRSIVDREDECSERKMSMTLLWLCVLWVFASAGVAMLPIRHQYIPVGVLLVLAFVLIVMIAMQVGWLMALLGVAAFVSMFRNPLLFIVAKLRGQNPQIPQ
jgi:hypothetical protein